MKVLNFILFLFPGLFLLLIFISSCAVVDDYVNENLNKEIKEKEQVISFVKDEGSISVYFCPQDNCEERMISFLSGAEEFIHCAWYDFNLVNTSEFLKDKSQAVEFKVVIDEDNQEKIKDYGWNYVVNAGYGLMHNKFCVVDGDRVMTGSMNPTKRDTTTNNNNLLFIESKIIAENYEQEFLELWNKEKNRKTAKTNVLLNKVEVYNYFCPDDECADKVVREIRKAESSVYFMTFSFTHS